MSLVRHSGSGYRGDQIHHWFRRMVSWKQSNQKKFLIFCLISLNLPPPPLPQVLAVVIIQVERMKGCRSSVLLFLFWTFLVLCSLVPLKADVEQIIDQVPIYYL